MKWFLLIIFLAHHSASEHDCYHPISDIRLTNVPQDDSDHSRVKRAPQNLRITPYYDSSYTSMANSSYITQNILNPAIQYWQNALLVNSPLTKPLIVDRTCTGSSFSSVVNKVKVRVCTTACAAQELCSNAQIPDQYLQACYTGSSSYSYTTSGTTGAGAADTDLLLIVTQQSTDCTGSVLAYATACLIFNRPVLGLINICPGMLSVGVGQKKSIATLKHEIGHVLGMSSDLFAFWHSQSGVPLTPRDSNGMPNLGMKIIGNSSIHQYSDSTVKEYSKTFNYPTGPSTRTVSYIVTPTVQQEMRNYFQCPTVEGMMLEDYGTSISALSHFEKLYLQNELMTATDSVNGLVSRFTLAVLQDTGWYVANFDNAENFNYAKGIGCNFLTSSCYEYINSMQSLSQSLVPYCNQPRTVGGLTCTPDLMFQQVCNLYDNSNLASQVPAQFKYFANPNWVGSDPFSDYCPSLMIYALSSSGSYVYTGECQDTFNSAVQGTANDYFTQSFGSNSICVGFSRPPNWYYELNSQPVIPSIQGAGCYQVQCSETNGLVIVVNNLQYNCTTANQIIDVSSKNAFIVVHGSLVCPACSADCKSSICSGTKSTLPTSTTTFSAKSTDSSQTTVSINIRVSSKGNSSTASSILLLMMFLSLLRM